MNGVGVSNFRGGNDGWNVEIAVAHRGRPNADRFVGQSGMHGVGIGGGMNRDGFDAQFLAGAVDTHRDLAAIGYENFVEHCVGQPKRGSGPVLFQQQ